MMTPTAQVLRQRNGFCLSTLRIVAHLFRGTVTDKGGEPFAAMVPELSLSLGATRPSFLIHA